MGLRNPIVLQEPSICPKPEQQVEFVGTFNTQHKRSMTLADQAKRVAAEFDFDDNAVNKAVKEFIREMDEGLEKEGTEMSQIPTYVTAVPNGTEKGLYMAVDLGGTNFRVCSIELHGNTTFSLTQSKVAIPRELMVAKTSKELFSFLAKQIEAFLKLHHEEHYAGTLRRREGKEGEPQDEEIFNLGFTFSFPVHQIGINKGMLMRWTKGFDIQDAVGKDVCALLQQEIDELHLPVKVAALVNDTVGTLMARSYTSPGKTGTLLGAIFGTGTNGAYVEKLDKVRKMTTAKNVGEFDKSTGEMIVNTEWGSFDNSLRTLPNTPYDVELDEKSVNPGIQMFEKRVSGMFLGELLRLALVKLIKDPKIPLFQDDNSSSNDTSAGLRVIRQTLDKDFKVNEEDVVDVGVDGSLVEFYPDFEEHIRAAMRAVPQIGAHGEKHIRIGIAKDGSGVGAALIALVAGQVPEPKLK